MKILLSVFSGVSAGIIGNLANPHISNIELLIVMAIGISGILAIGNLTRNNV